MEREMERETYREKDRRITMGLLLRLAQYGMFAGAAVFLLSNLRPHDEIMWRIGIFLTVLSLLQVGLACWICPDDLRTRKDS